ncbi:Sporulation and spore germination [compost metagenome]
MYYTDPQVMELLESKQEISYETDLQKYQAAFKALQNSDHAELISLWGKIELLSLNSNEGAVTIDINMPNEARLGSGGEMYAIDALRNTFFQFDEVKSIELLVNGAQVESLMGHVELEHPMTKK